MRTHPAAQALLAGLMQGHGQKHGDEAMIRAGMWLAGVARRTRPACRRCGASSTRPACRRVSI
jgi:hypothetical protein